MKVLIIDDSIDKISKLTEVISTLSFKCSIDNTETISNAILLLKENLYDIAIVDLHLPLRVGDEPISNGGKQLLEEIYRKNGILCVPKYILGFSQYDDEIKEFSPIWNVIRYSPSDTEWKSSILYLFKHVFYTSKNDIVLPKEILPTVIVEGVTDLNFINTSIDLFFPTKKEKFILKSQSNAGANWVANQVVIWSLQGFKDDKGVNIKSIGLLDSDEAGNLAKKVINERLKSQNEQKAFKIVQILPKYNKEILKFYREKCKIELEIESLFPMEVLEYADSQNWLEHRNQTFVENPNDWEQHSQTSSQYMLSKGISENQLLYTKKVKIGKKIEFSKYVLGIEDKKATFKNFELLVKELISALEID